MHVSMDTYMLAYLLMYIHTHTYIEGSLGIAAQGYQLTVSAVVAPISNLPWKGREGSERDVILGIGTYAYTHVNT